MNLGRPMTPSTYSIRWWTPLKLLIDSSIALVDNPIDWAASKMKAKFTRLWIPGNLKPLVSKAMWGFLVFIAIFIPVCSLAQTLMIGKSSA